MATIHSVPLQWVGLERYGDLCESKQFKRWTPLQTNLNPKKVHYIVMNPNGDVLWYKVEED